MMAGRTRRETPGIHLSEVERIAFMSGYVRVYDFLTGECACRCLWPLENIA